MNRFLIGFVFMILTARFFTETLSLAPIDRRLIDTRMLTAKERAWLDAYHARLHEAVGPLMDAETRAWLEAATRPL